MANKNGMIETATHSHEATEPNNISRASSAAIAIRAHSEAVGTTKEDELTQVSDLICNLLHFCQQNGVEWGEALSAANSNYEYECDEHGQS